MSRSILYTKTTGSDSNPTLAATLTYADGTVVNGTGHGNPQLLMRREYASANVTFTGSGAWVTPSAGTVTYTFASTDLDALTPGIYNLQWVDTDAGNRKMHLDGGQVELRKGF